LIVLVICTFVLAACAPQSVPVTGATASPASASTQETTSTPTLVPINLAGPEMAVGSKWLYADGSILVAVPSGIFTMGRANGVDNPEHQVNLSEFWIYRTKVTNFQYAFCVAQGGCTPPSLTDNPDFADPIRGNDPVTGVTWTQSAAYCEFVHARLPTEAEWEKTARGPDANIYPWGDGAPSCGLLNYDNCIGKPTKVNQYPQGQSYYEAFDMAGNIFEWVADRYRDNYYVNSPADDPLGPEFGDQRSVRSSGFDSGGNQAAAFNRFFSRPEDHRSNLGFRCVVEEPQYFASFCTYPAVYGTDGVGGPASGEQVSVDCPDLSIHQSLGCIRTQPSTGVTLNGPAGSDVSVPEPACAPLSGPGSTTCTDHGQLSICSQCTVTTTSDPQCPDGYTFDADAQTCVGQPGPGACLPGFVPGDVNLTRLRTLDENTPVSPAPGDQCCTLAAGPVTLGEGPLVRGGVFPSCPAGTSFDGQHCVSVDVIYPYCKSEGVALNSCQPGGGPECNKTAADCGFPNCHFDADSCSCTYDTSCG
ncbi:MAG TPA: formylglycine-generating enzyme family protein, partial [Gemmatimonadales bacterium]|nr:formylglycine-generating enzyme family protein [Gemmatimonadales bacterium]